ncbi:WAT1-related protein At5g40240-like [Diospyros lotus]|uniref:WAT1-related protein At5g40240-like n=1 Tax=Diospyros lotus TaxID=55363 RepID=UPI00224CE7A3|nr:WAT1-related protein At5g40240-like [Diospyros lotus]
MGLEAWPCVKEGLPFVLMLMMEFGDVCTITLGKAAMSSGMSKWVFVVYYNALGTLILLLFFVLHRHRSKQPPITFPLLCRFCILALFGICFVQIGGYAAIDYSSPTLAAAMSNLVPAFTFLLAVSFRMEKFELRKTSSQAKAFGAIVAILGAFIIIFYKGPSLLMAAASSNLPHRLSLSRQSKWILGGFLLGFCGLVYSTWNILLTATVKDYPDKVTVIFFQCFFGTIQCAIFSIIAERNPSSWTLQPGLETTAVVFAAVFSTVFRSSVLTWCLHKKGPVYVAMFKPTQMVIAQFLGIIFLGDTLHLGSVIGGTIIAAGFYTVSWGKAKEEEMVGSACTLESSPENTPLLQDGAAQER